MADKPPFIIADRCRCCDGGRLVSVLDMGDMPLANGFHMGEVQAKFPLNMMACQDCFHGQLSVVVDGEIMFANYAYMSSVSNTFKDHCRRLVETAMPRVSNPRPSVLDIACNDGLLLSLFAEKGCEVLGVDPAKNLKPFTDSIGVPVVHDFWSRGVAENLNKKFDIITAQNVFAHVHDLHDFLDGCHAALNDDGVVLIEFAYCLELIVENEFDTIYHEHLSYFLVRSFATLVERSGFYIDDILQTAIHGGSIRFVLKKTPGRNAPIVDQLIRVEKERGLYDMATYAHFRDAVETNRQRLVELVRSLKRNGEKVVGYCASAKGITMLNYFDVDLDYIVDDTELKQGRLIPGKNTPILKPFVLQQEKNPVNIVLLAWNFAEELKRRITALRGHRDNLILYVPEVKIMKMS